MAKNIIIIEAYGKVKSYEKYVGKDYQVYPTHGHCVDLPVKKLGIDIKNGFLPTWEVKEDSEDTIKKLKSACKNADNVYLMTDEDREGEAIAFHIYEQIQDSCKGTIHRASTNQITKTGIQAALANPGKLDQDKINAYLARRMLDRLAGYKTSYLTQQSSGGRSAGRVQSAVLRIIVDREKEIVAFKPVGYWVLTAYLLNSKGDKYTAILTEKIKVPDKATADKIYKECVEATPRITKVETKEVESKAWPPFTTMPMVASAASIFGWSASKTMKVAQGLYSAGHCVLPDDIITFADGTICEMQDIENMNADVPVVGFDRFDSFNDSTTFGTTKSFVEEIQKKNYSGDMYHFRTLDGQEITATPDHRFLVFRENKVQWEESQSINTSDFMLCTKGMDIERGTLVPHIFFLINQLPDETLKDIRVAFNGNYDIIDSIIESHRDEIAESTYYKYKRLHKIPIIWFISSLFESTSVGQEKYHESLGYECLKYIDYFQMQGQPEFFSTEDFCYFLGLYLGDGHSAECKITFPRCIMSTEKWAVLLGSLNKEYSFESDTTINVSGPVLKRLCEHFGGKLGNKSDSIFIHPFISSMPREVIMRFLAGLWDSDGCINIKHRLSISYTTISSKMAKQLNVLLRGLGFQSGIHHRSGDYKNCSVKLLRTSGVQFLNEITPYLLVKRDYCESLLSVVGEQIGAPQNFNFPVIKLVEQARKDKNWTKQKLSKIVFGDSSTYWNYLRTQPDKNRPYYLPPAILKEIGVVLENQLLINLANGQVYFASVKDVKKRKYEGLVYDITTSTESFICNTFVSHNCTYHRTDSPIMASEALGEVRSFIGHSYGDAYLPPKANFYAPKKGAQEAHECCRPTTITAQTLAGLSGDDAKLYDLIWRRAISSQMTKARDRRMKVITKIAKYDFVSNGRKQLFDGFRKVWTYSSNKDVILPDLEEGEECVLKALEKD